ncbi:MAG: DNA polymerase III subunit epsilon, partial [Gammaproteobacteria bacterium]|nr:DNA polymerase III subunit epsilon [Gammaproteobacteria bacterium]
VPAAFWAKQNHRRVLISTNTINLQDQIINKDIPAIVQALNLDLNAIVLKGRSNYICPRKFNLLRKQGPRSEVEMRMLGKIMVWQYLGGSGDRTELNLNGPIENDIWQRLSANDEFCTSETCSAQQEVCPFH